MKVVLKKAVLKLGVPGDVVEVRPGFAFNYLIPTGVALFASEENLQEFEKKKADLIKEHEKAKDLATNVKNAIEGKYLLMERPVNEAGNFYSVISPLDVKNELTSQFGDTGFEFDKNHILVSNKIRNYGIYDITVTLYHGISCKMKLSIAQNKVLADEAIKAKESK